MRSPVGPDVSTCCSSSSTSWATRPPPCLRGPALTTLGLRGGGW